MTDELNEGNQAAQGEQVAKPDTSAPEGQLSQDNFNALMARLETLEKQNRALQSGKDKRFNEIMPVIERVADVLGLDKDKVREAQEKAVLQDLVAERLAPRQPEAGTGTTEPKASVVEILPLISEYNLNPNDVDVAQFIAQNTGKFNDQPQAELAVARFMKAKIAKPTLTPDQTPVSTGGKPDTKLSSAAIEAKSAKLSALYKNYSKNATEIAALEKEIGIA